MEVISIDNKHDACYEMFKSSGLETDKDILRATKQFLKTTIQKKDTDNLSTYKANANPKINIPMSENIGQRRQ